MQHRRCWMLRTRQTTTQTQIERTKERGGTVLNNSFGFVVEVSRILEQRFPLRWLGA